VIKRPKMRINGVEEGTEKQTKGIQNLFNEIIAENFPNLGNDMDIQIQEAFKPPDRHDQKR
jgi:hypothetical protein